MSGKNKVFFSAALILQLSLAGTVSAQTAFSWPQAVDKLQKRVAQGSLGGDVSITFQNAPFKKFTEDELMAYTFRSDGEVIVQMADRVSQTRVPPAELLWLARFILEHKIEDFPEKEPRQPDSASFAVVLKIGSLRKGIWLYNRANDIHREIVWQYLFRQGQVFLENSGLRDKDQAVLPVCEGIKSFEESDVNNDGIIDWLRLKIGFRNLKAGKYFFDFSGVSQEVFLSAGRVEREFFLNTYLLQRLAGEDSRYLDLFIDSRPAQQLGPYRMKLGLDSRRYRAKNLRTSPDFRFLGPGENQFLMRPHQSASVELKTGPEQGQNSSWSFTLGQIAPEGAGIFSRGKSFFLSQDEKLPLGDFGCVSGWLGFAGMDRGSAVFKVGWSVPETGAVQRKIEYFQEALADPDYPGDKETAGSSLDFAQECLEQSGKTEDLQINLIFTSPGDPA